MKKRLFIIMMAMVFLIPCMVSAKSYQAEIFGYGGSGEDYFVDVEATSDGGYVVVGESYLDSFSYESEAIIAKYDKNDKEIWGRTFGSNDVDFFSGVAVTDDGGYIAVGGTYSTDIDGITNKGYSDTLIVKFDKNGDVEWSNSLGGSRYDQFYRVIVTSDGGFVAVGNFNSTDIDGLNNLGSYDGLIAKYDKNGKLVWQQNYGGNDYEYLYGVGATADGGVVVVGSSESTNIEGLENKGNDDAIIAKFDEKGNLEWQQSYGGKYYDEYSGVAVTKEGEFVVIGGTSSDDIEGLPNNRDHKSLIVKYDKNGKFLWQQYYSIGEDGDMFNLDVDLDAAGNIITAGVGMPCGQPLRVEDTALKVIEPVEPETCSNYLVVGKYNSVGELEWQGSYIDDYSDNYLYGVTVTKDGDYVTAGYSNSQNIEGIENQGYEDGIILKIKPIYDITEEEPKNGDFTAIEEDRKGKIEVKPDPGYVVDKIIVTDSLDNEVPTSKDGDYYYFELYDDVKVRVTFKEATILDIINPETGSGQIIEFVIIIGLVVGGLIYFNRKKVFGK